MPKKVSKYVDGFVIVMPKKNLEMYKAQATLGRDMWMKYGALDYKECIMDDARPKGVLMPFPKLANAKSSEVVVFSYILFKSRAHRDAVNKKVMKDPSMTPGNMEMAFDMNRMSYGGFSVLVE